jgi:ribonuclease-3
MRSLDYKHIEKKLKIRFKRRTMLKTALTHSSYSTTSGASNEVLEFLGDAVLELVTREYLCKLYPLAREGELSERKKIYTSTEALYRAGKKSGLGRYVFMSKGERTSGGQMRPSIIANTMEALIGALYLDRGLPYTRKFIQRILLQRKRITSKDYKSLANQWAMKHRKKLSYRIVKETGPPHQRVFRIHLFIGKTRKAVGIGKSKKDAEQQAAAQFLKRYGKR